MIDTLLVNPNNRLDSAFAAVEPPLWTGLIASDLMRKGETVDILDAEASGLNTEQTVQAIKALKPKRVIVAVMGNNPSVSSTPKMVVTKKLVEMVRDIFPTFVTGLHPSALPEQTKKELGVPVLEGKIFDGTPPMPWAFLNPRNYRTSVWHCLDGSPRSPYGVTYTSLGCPFNCSFCNIHSLYGSRQVWYRDPADVAKEVDVLVQQHKVRNIKFWDELFTLSTERVIELCNLLIERNYDLNIWAYARTDRVSRPLLELMRKAGIKWLAYGFESGCDEVLSKVSKRTTLQESIDAVRMTHGANINIIGNFLFGLGYDEETLEFAKTLRLEYVNFYDVKPYPGSDIYNGSTDWKSYSQYGNSHSFQDEAFKDFFTSEEYLRRVEKQFGTQAIRQIEAMLKRGKPKDVSTLRAST